MTLVEKENIMEQVNTNAKGVDFIVLEIRSRDDIIIHAYNITAQQTDLNKKADNILNWYKQYI